MATARPKLHLGRVQEKAGSFGADRDDFADAIDFVGWYNHQSVKRSGISPQNTYGLYLAYHEGHGGYNRATYCVRTWLMTVARKVKPGPAAIRRS